MTVEITTGTLPFDVIISCGKPEIITVQPNEPVSIVIDMKRDGKDGVTPVKGVDYFDGVTPVKGVDYFDGITPVKGVDYFDGVTPVKGVDYFDGVDGVDGTTDIIITGAGYGVLADFTRTTTNTIVKTFPTPENLFNNYCSFLMRLNVIKGATGSCTVRVYFNTVQSISLGSPILLSTSTLTAAQVLGNISKNITAQPAGAGIYIVPPAATSSFIDYAGFSTFSAINLPATSGFLIIAFQLGAVLERAFLSSFNLSKI